MNSQQIAAQSVCPGCGLARPHSDFPYGGYYHASRECWSVYTEVLAREYEDAVLFGRVHQLTVDAYAVQHAGGPHPDKSVCVHLVGLHLALTRGVALSDIPPRFQQLIGRVKHWPHFEAPSERSPLTVHDVALADTPPEHATRARAWAEAVWQSWSPHHAAIANLAALTYGE